MCVLVAIEPFCMVHNYMKCAKVVLDGCICVPHHQIKVLKECLVGACAQHIHGSRSCMCVCGGGLPLLSLLNLHQYIGDVLCNKNLIAINYFRLITL